MFGEVHDFVYDSVAVEEYGVGHSVSVSMSSLDSRILYRSPCVARYSLSFSRTCSTASSLLSTQTIMRFILCTLGYEFP